MKKINFHTHTNRCRHADGIAADYVQSALSAGVTQLGFSDHAPFPDYDFGMRMPYCELSEYIEDINALTVQYRTDIILWKGLEIEYLPEYRDYYEALLTRSGMDYLLMGEHFYKNASGKTTNYTDALSTDEFPVYAQNVADGMKTGLFWQSHILIFIWLIILSGMTTVKKRLTLSLIRLSLPAQC